MQFHSEERPKGWTEYGQLVLSKLEELHEDNKEIKDDLKQVKDRLLLLEASKKDVEELESWKDKVDEVWSPTQMKEVSTEVYKQKEKWTGVWFVFITIQVIWGIVVFFKDKLLNK